VQVLKLRYLSVITWACPRLVQLVPRVRLHGGDVVRIRTGISRFRRISVFGGLL